MEDSAYSSLKNSLSSISAKALNYSSRLILANNLNCKQVLLSPNGIAKDYRGLAQLMGFQYLIIKRFEESEDRTMKILEAWETRPDATLDKLISFLEDMDRHDIIGELIPSLEKDVEEYKKYQRSLEIPIQVAEVTPGPMNLHSKRGVLTLDDKIRGECTIYDAYVSYADEDESFAFEFAAILEKPQIGLKLFIRGRDMLLGCSELDTDIELIKNRCRHMLILLTPNFIKSPALEFQVSFAGSLAIEQKQRILIPVILAPCEIPPILNSVSKIDFTKEHIQDWMWDKLITSLMPEDNAFLSSLGRSPLRCRNMIPNAAASVSTESRPVITFPQTARQSICSLNNSTTLLTITPVEASDDNKGSGPCSEMKDSVSCSEVREPPASPSKTSPSPRRFQQFMSLLKRKGHSSSTSSTSFTSGATSGFHSQSCSNIKSIENASDQYNVDTSL